jgi:hypothetical protein
MIEDILEGEYLRALSYCLGVMSSSCASHEFMSAMHAKRVKLVLIVAKPSYMISTPGGRVVANQIAREVSA